MRCMRCMRCRRCMLCMRFVRFMRCMRYMRFMRFMYFQTGFALFNSLFVCVFYIDTRNLIEIGVGVKTERERTHVRWRTRKSNYIVSREMS